MAIGLNLLGALGGFIFKFPMITGLVAAFIAGNIWLHNRDNNTEQRVIAEIERAQNEIDRKANIIRDNAGNDGMRPDQFCRDCEGSEL